MNSHCSLCYTPLTVHSHTPDIPATGNKSLRTGFANSAIYGTLLPLVEKQLTAAATQHGQLFCSSQLVQTVEHNTAMAEVSIERIHPSV